MIAEAYAYADGEGAIPQELKALSYIDRFGHNAGEAIRAAVDAIEPAATGGSGGNQIVIKGKDGKPVKLTPMK